MKVNNIEFEPIEYTCPECGAVNKIKYTYKESNKSIQARCKCGKWIGNVKYDKRSKEQIRRDKINEWKKGRSGSYLVDVCLTEEDAKNNRCITMTFSELTKYIDKIFRENQNLECLYVKKHDEV